MMNDLLNFPSTYRVRDIQHVSAGLMKVLASEALRVALPASPSGAQAEAQFQSFLLEVYGDKLIEGLGKYNG